MRAGQLRHLAVDGFSLSSRLEFLLPFRNCFRNGTPKRTGAPGLAEFMRFRGEFGRGGNWFPGASETLFRTENHRLSGRNGRVRNWFRRVYREASGKFTGSFPRTGIERRSALISDKCRRISVLRWRSLNAFGPDRELMRRRERAFFRAKSGGCGNIPQGPANAEHHLS